MARQMARLTWEGTLEAGHDASVTALPPSHEKRGFATFLTGKWAAMTRLFELLEPARRRSVRRPLAGTPL